MKNLYKIFTLSLYFLYIAHCEAQTGWFELNSGTGELLYSVFFTNPNTGFIGANYGVVLKTTNAGVNWTSQQLPTTYQLRYIYFTDAITGYIASGSSTNSVGDAFKTTNGGNTWNSISLPVYTHFYRVYFINSNTGYLTGWEHILKTTNAGSTWEDQTFSGFGFISHIYFINANTGFACAFNSYKILKSTNGGANWQEIFTGSTYLTGIAFNSSNTGTVVGGSSTPGSAYILRTTNEGASWTNYIFNNSNIPRLYSINFINSNTGYIAGGGMAGGNCTIMKTTNGGVDWYFQITNFNNGLMGSYFINENTGYAVGYNGTILKTTDGGGIMLGINSESNKIPEQFSLSQNYPNPFNPVTVISYQLVVNSFATLKVYDLLGKEVVTLVNGKQQPGTYEVEFDGTNYPSGIYYYRLTTDNFNETKIMILVK
jgi:photosystem II stability/assembly factor-like uncharacterized protein